MQPNPMIFQTALSRLGASPDRCLHIGDDRRNDIWGARDAGILAWLWGEDVNSFEEAAERILRGKFSPFADDFEEEVEEEKVPRMA